MDERYLIKNTTREERRRIVEESVGNIEAMCDGCAGGILDMYDDYIEGKRELREVNEAFRGHYCMEGRGDPPRGGCGFAG